MAPTDQTVLTAAPAPNPALLGLAAALRGIVGRDHVFEGTEAAILAGAAWGRLGCPLAAVRPGSTEEVSAIVRLAAAAGVPIVPWGGMSGLVDGCYAQGALALSLSRMRDIEEIDTEGATMTVEAGCVVEAAADAAEAAGLFLPLDLGSRGTATIGGVISTNAGGNRVLRYGMARDMVLGLEVVLADGQVVSAMNRLIKNNTGYDVKQLFIGAEGTLGIVTRAVLRLRPAQPSQMTAFLGVARFADLPLLLRRLERGLGGQLSAFEVMWPEFHALVTTPPAAGHPVLAAPHAFYVLAESLGGDPAGDAARFESVLAAALAEGLVEDAVIAKSQAERDRMWALRDDVRQTARDGPIAAFDVSLPISAMEPYVARVRAGLAAHWPASEGPTPRLTVFGHLGDGNLHLIAGVPEPEDRPAVTEIVYAALPRLTGSISAEHGVGLQKRAHLSQSRSDPELALMRRIKAALDPAGVFNPGKILG